MSYDQYDHSPEARARRDEKLKAVKPYTWTIINGDREFLVTRERQQYFVYTKGNPHPSEGLLVQWHPYHRGGVFMGWYYDPVKDDTTVYSIPVERVWAVHPVEKPWTGIPQPINVSEPLS